MPTVYRPYPLSLDEPLFWWNRQNPFTIRDACEGVQITGDMGSGKTSGSGKTLALAMLRAGFGGLVLCKKTDECSRWIDYLAEAGRLDSALVVNPRRHPWRFNFLDYQIRRGGYGAGHVENVVNLFANVLENRKQARGGTSRRQDDFWIDNTKRLIKFLLEALLLAQEPVTMARIQQLILGLPRPGSQWPKPSVLLECLAKGKVLEQTGRLTYRGSTPDAVRGYFEGEFGASGADRQSAGILSQLTSMADPFFSGPIQELFCTTTNFVPEFSRKGTVILLDMPTDEWEDIGFTTQLTFKYLWQKALLRRQGLQEPGDVPCFLWMDEAQNFITPMDKEFQETSRSSVVCSVFLSQNINNYLAGFHENAEAMANALLGGLATKIFHRNGDYKTNQWASETISKQRVAYYNSSTSTGYQSNWGSTHGHTSSSESGASTSTSMTRGGGDQRGNSEGWSEQLDFQVQPEFFTRLRYGSPVNNNEVEAIVFKSGARFLPYGKPFTGVIFPQ